MQKSKLTIKRVICPECKGKGIAASYQEDELYTGYVWDSCNLCKGVGMVEKIKTISYKQIKIKQDGE